MNDECQKCGDILKENQVDPNEKSTFRKWSLKNHPDKGGDLNKFQSVSNCFDILKEGGSCTLPITEYKSKEESVSPSSGFEESLTLYETKPVLNKKEPTSVVKESLLMKFPNLLYRGGPRYYSIRRQEIRKSRKRRSGSKKAKRRSGSKKAKRRSGSKKAKRRSGSKKAKRISGSKKAKRRSRL